MSTIITILLIADAAVTLWLLGVTLPEVRRIANKNGVDRGRLVGRAEQLQAVSDELSNDTLRREIDRINADRDALNAERGRL